MAEHKALPPWRRGAPVTARRLNRIQQNQVRTLRGGPGVTVRVAGQEVTIRNANRVGRDLGLVQMMEIYDIFDDHLECYLYNAVDAEAGTQVVFVARPYQLQRTPFDGEIIVYANGQSVEYTYVDDRKRSADDGSSSETQVMTPDYYEGDIILAIRNIAGGTGLTATKGATTIAIQWMDLNTAGRFWAKEA